MSKRELKEVIKRLEPDHCPKCGADASAVENPLVFKSGWLRREYKFCSVQCFESMVGSVGGAV